MGVVNKALGFRKEQEDLLGWTKLGDGCAHEGCKHAAARKLGDVTTLNVTMLKTGVSVDGGEGKLELLLGPLCGRAAPHHFRAASPNFDPRTLYRTLSPSRHSRFIVSPRALHTTLFSSRVVRQDVGA